MTPTLIIIRGIPGAGKSTLARRIANALSEFHDNFAEEIPICEADQFFTDSKGNYHWHAHLVPAAHEWCRRKVETAMQKNKGTIILSNTSTVRSRLEPYLELARKYGYAVQQIVCFGEFGSTHKVPEETMKGMRDQLRQSLLQELKNGELL